MAQEFKEVSAQRINLEKYESNYEKIFGKKEIDASDNPRVKGALICPIHDVDFSIDEGCPVCVEQEDCEIAWPYQKHIQELNRQIQKLKNQLNENSFKE